MVRNWSTVYGNVCKYHKYQILKISLPQFPRYFPSLFVYIILPLKVNFCKKPAKKYLVYMTRKLNLNFMLQNSNSIFPPCRLKSKKNFGGFHRKIRQKICFGKSSNFKLIFLPWFMKAKGFIHLGLSTFNGVIHREMDNEKLKNKLFIVLCCAECFQKERFLFFHLCYYKIQSR